MDRIQIIMSELSIKKRAFTAAEKQAIVLDLKFTKASTPRATAGDIATKYQLNSASSITKWSKCPKLFDQSTGSPIPLSAETRNKKKFHPGPHLKRSDLEEHLFQYWSGLREDGKVVTVQLLVTEAVRYFKNLGTDLLSLDSMRQIVRRFMAHHNLGYRTKTHSGTFIDEEEMATTIVDFVTSFRNLSTSLQVPASRIFNMDQTAVYYDNAPLKTIEKRGS